MTTNEQKLNEYSRALPQIIEILEEMYDEFFPPGSDLREKIDQIVAEHDEEEYQKDLRQMAGSTDTDLITFRNYRARYRAAKKNKRRPDKRK